MFYEIVIAPGYTPEGLEVLKVRGWGWGGGWFGCSVNRWRIAASTQLFRVLWMPAFLGILIPPGPQHSSSPFPERSAAGRPVLFTVLSHHPIIPSSPSSSALPLTLFTLISKLPPLLSPPLPCPSPHTHAPPPPPSPRPPHAAPLTPQGKSKTLRILEAKPRAPSGRQLRQVGAMWLKVDWAGFRSQDSGV